MSSRHADVVDIHWTEADFVSLLLDDDEFSTDTSSDSSDWSEYEVVPRRTVKAESTHFVVTSRYRGPSQNLSDEEFLEQFRVNRELADSLVQQFRTTSFYGHVPGNAQPVSAYDHLIIFLWFAGHKVTFEETCEQFEIPSTSLYRIIQRVSGFLSSMADTVITWPTESETKDSAEYYRLKGIPFTIGAIGVDDIKIDIDKDSNFSLPLQVVCDHTKRIRHAHIGSNEPLGSYKVFHSSRLFKELSKLCAHYVILGDHHFPCLRNLVSPYRGTLTPNQKLFNQVLSQGRGTVEGCLRRLKVKFPQLEKCQLRVEGDVKQFVIACCVLYNLSVDDDFLQNTGRTLQCVMQLTSALENCSDVKDTPDGLAYRHDLLTAISVRRGWK